VRVSDHSAISQAALAFLDGLDPRQLDAVCFPLADEHVRSDWHYTPRDRAGLALGQLRPDQFLRLQTLIAASCSLAGQAQVNAIIALESTLARLEPWFRERDPSLYTTCVFGEPSDPVWAFRFEGHHVSLNVTVTPQGIGATPSFLGANPAAIRGTSGVVTRPLGPEEDTARALLAALDPPTHRRAIIADTAPADLLHANAPSITPQDPIGVPAADLPYEARALVRALLAAWAERLPPEVAARELDRLDGPDGNQLWFAWAGRPEPGNGWYYRLTGPRLWIEADCTQDRANHVHSVWRDPEGDFGRDLLREHLALDHAPDVANATAATSETGLRAGAPD
jgi:hypothetical protein